MAVGRFYPGREENSRSREETRPLASDETDQDRLIWRQFAEATTPKAFCQGWLLLQCRLLKGIRCAMVLLGEPDRGPFTPVAFWPDAKLGMQHLAGAAERALKERRGLFLEPDSQAENGPEICHVAYPVEVSGKIHGVVVLEVEQSSRFKVQELMRQLYWGAGWLEVLIRRSEAVNASDSNEQLRKTLDLVTSAVEYPSFSEAAIAFVTRAATTLECERVSLGLLKRKRVRVGFLSHSTHSGKQTNLVKAIESAMEEAIDQRSVVLFPQPSSAVPLVIRAHEVLAGESGSGSVLTIPLETQGKFFGGMVLERSAEKPFDQGTMVTCEAAAALIGAILETKRLQERFLLLKAADSLALQLRRLLGPGYLVRKLVFICLAALVVFFSLFKVDYRVTATTSIEGLVQRVVAAPFDGYVREAPVRPGDVVTEGQTLCFLDDRDIKLERIKWVTEKEQFLKQLSEAVAKHDRSQIQIIRAKINQAEAQLALIEEQLSRTKVVAPFDGIVMSGDLSQSLGAPAQRGQVLFEVAPLDKYRVIAHVDERAIGEIKIGQRSEMVLPSMPGDKFPFYIEKVTPVSEAKDGKNSFRVEGRMEQSSPRLRPGMEGVGKITIDRRRLIWVWTHEAFDWVRLQLWRWMP